MAWTNFIAVQVFQNLRMHKGRFHAFVYGLSYNTGNNKINSKLRAEVVKWNLNGLCRGTAFIEKRKFKI